jgi:hypothetical protein
MFADKARAFPIEAPLRGEAPLNGRLLASPTNIRLGWKGLPGIKTLAYYKNP